jgi:hypothetical protein
VAGSGTLLVNLIEATAKSVLFEAGGVVAKN